MKKKYEKPNDTELRTQLTPLQYQVTQCSSTEPPFANAFWDNDQPGIYVDIITGEPLFSSLDKFDSGTGWPSFLKALAPENLIALPEEKITTQYEEIRSKHANSHLGHLFYDGPQPTGLRYCINSAALRFIPFEDLEKEGYGEYAHIFKSTKT